VRDDTRDTLRRLSPGAEERAREWLDEQPDPAPELSLSQLAETSFGGTVMISDERFEELLGEHETHELGEDDIDDLILYATEQKARADRLESELAEYRAVVETVRKYADRIDGIGEISSSSVAYDLDEMLPAVQPEGSEPR
jgi:hypothetical protein